MRFLLLSILILLLFAANIFFGAIDIPVADVCDILCGDTGIDTPLGFIVLGSRIPAAITALLGGAGLAVTGLMLQTAFRNPLAGPSILGISSGASLGVALVMLFFGGSITLGTLSFGGYTAVITGALAGSLAIMGLLITFSTRVKGDLMLLIIGIMTGYLTSSLVTLLSSLSTAEGVRGYVMWGMGSFSGVTLPQLGWFAGMTGIGLLLSLLLAKPLNILLLGENYARNLGVRVGRVRNLLLLVTGILTAVITAYCGPVAFIGLAMPHIARMVWRTDNHWILMPGTMLCGSATALLCCLLSVLPAGNVIPINALTPLIGVPVIIYVIFRRNRG